MDMLWEIHSEIYINIGIYLEKIILFKVDSYGIGSIKDWFKNMEIIKNIGLMEVIGEKNYMMDHLT